MWASLLRGSSLDIDCETCCNIEYQISNITYQMSTTFGAQTKADHDVAANRTQDNLDRQRKHIEDSVKKMTKAASGKGGDQKKSGQVSHSESDRRGRETNLSMWC